jgi:3-hydroxyisobutyrate dehydrogenase
VADVIGFIGTGIMGAPMVRNLLKAGFQVRAYNRTRSKAEALVVDGAMVADSPAAAAQSAIAVITCVSDSPDVEEVFLGEQGVCSTIGRDVVAVDMSTIAPAVARKVAQAVEQKGALFVDAPVSGGQWGAIQGTLSIMAGGSAEAFTKARPYFEAMGKTIVHCGPTGAGQITKLCNQILCAVNLLGLSEAIAFARKSNLNLEAMLQAVSAGAAGSWAVSNLGPRIVKGDFAPGFMIDLQQKDLRITLETAREVLASLPATSLAHQLFAANQAKGEGREGTQALAKTLLRLSDLL